MQKSPAAYHWAVQMLPSSPPLEDRTQCVELWRGLRRLFPRVFASVLMPTHVHVSDPGAPTARKRSALARLLSKFGDWNEVSMPTWIADDRHLARTIRYIHLNPCRDRLCRDPLDWEWSTHRDFIGAVTYPWPEVAKTLRRIGYRSSQDFHAYVSADPSAHAAGTPAPLEPLIRPALLDLTALERAAAIAARVPWQTFRKKGRLRGRLLRALKGIGVPGAQVARHFGVDPTSVEIVRPGDVDWLQPALRVLADTRLLGNPGNRGFRNN